MGALGTILPPPASPHRCHGRRKFRIRPITSLPAADEVANFGAIMQPHMPPRKTGFPPIADHDSRILILGTMPGEKSLELQQYYGHRGNQFWRILFALFHTPFTEDYRERVRVLHVHKIALWDVLATCERQGSADSNITNETANDFGTLYTRCPYIRAIFFSGKKAEALYGKYAIHPNHLPVFTLPSPSGAHASVNLEAKIDAWRAITEHL